MRRFLGEGDSGDGRGRRARPVVALALVAAVAVSACGQEPVLVRVVSTTPGRPVSGDPATGDPSGDPSGGPGSGGTLAWAPCDEQEGFECASLDVPVDYADPDGDAVPIALARRRATDTAGRIGSLVVNPGGPGASGVDAAFGLVEELPEAVLARFDLVGFDPRGVGRSAPVVCSSDADKDRMFTLDQTPDTRAEIDALVAAELDANDACVKNNGDLLANLSTYDTARDLDRIRQAVADDRLTFLGFSYGTHLGAAYAELFPRNVRAMVLDGPVNPATGRGQDDSSSATDGFDEAFDRFAKACAAATTCPVHGDLAKLRDRLSDKADATPIPASLGDGRALSAGLFDLAVGAALYDAGAWPLLAVGLADADAGDGSVLLALADSYLGRDRDGHYSDLDDALRAINCADDPDRIEPADVRADADSLDVPPSDLDVGQLQGEAYCSGLPTSDTPFHPLHAKGAAPIVVIGTKGDPATVVTNAPKLARALGSGVSVVWEGDGHTAIGKSTCIDDLVARYLVDLAVPGPDTRCPAGDAASAATGGADGTTYGLDKDEYRDDIVAELEPMLGGGAGACVDRLLGALDDTEFVHFFVGVDLGGVQAKTDRLIRGC